jgi:hypothetical protein
MLFFYLCILVLNVMFGAVCRWIRWIDGFGVGGCELDGMGGREMGYGGWGVCERGGFGVIGFLTFVFGFATSY